MNKKKKLWFTILTFVILMSIVVGLSHRVNPKEDDTIRIERPQQHVIAMENGANPSLGYTQVSEDGTVEKDFVTHLPIAIIDLDGKEIPITKKVTASQDVYYTGEDPYISANLSIIDSDEYVNSPYDAPTYSSQIKVKYRGNNSLNFDKKQYGIKLVDSAGNSKKESVMGMEENNDWILNVSQLDESLIRNYLAYNVGSALFEGTPECKYCEVFLKNGDSYNYQGVYMMVEKVEKGKGRVDLADYEANTKMVDYLLCRDREDDTETQISTYGDKTGATKGRLTVLYPDAEVLDQYAFDYIENDIDAIEKIIYAEDTSTFESWPEYLDVNSFVDYFLFNELMGNYDAGDNSTYMYKRSSGKLCMGPVWDYDGSMDNGLDIANPEAFAFYESPWFEKLVTSKTFMKTACERYNQLSAKNAILSDEYLSEYVLEVSKYLGNAALRDRSRWSTTYDSNIVHDAKDNAGNVVKRDTHLWEDEVNRLSNYFIVKELYMNDSLKKLYNESTVNNTFYIFLSVVMVIGFICAIVLIRRKNYYK